MLSQGTKRTSPSFGDEPEMIDDNTSKLSRKVDGRFSYKVGDNPDIYKESEVISALENELSSEREALDCLRKQFTIGLFRNIIQEHTEKFDATPTKVILHYREFRNVVEAYNEESEGRYQSHYNETAVIDGITICKGCNTKPGEFRLETQIPE